MYTIDIYSLDLEGPSTMTDNTSPFDRRTFLKATGAVAGAGIIAGCVGGGNGDGGDGGDGDGGDGGDGGSGGDSFPSRRIRMVIPFGPGGGYDTYARLATKYLPNYLPNDVNLQVQNIEGAGGQIATEQVYAAEPDGYTHMIVNMVNFSLTQLTDDPEYDLRELTHFAQISSEFRGIAVGANTDIETWDDYVTAVQNEELNFASTGPGSGYVTVPGVIGEIARLYPPENVMDNQVIYDGRGEAVQGILSGDAQVMSGSYFSILPYVESGDVRMIMACTTEEQAPEQTPDAETFATAGVENGEQIRDMLTTRRLFSGPPGMDEDRATIIRSAYAGTINDADLNAEAAANDRPIVYADHEVTGTAVSTFIDSWSERRDLLEILFGQ
jgi:tripartite-type tricarboxylate transporter receptor subunit TctC